MFNVHLYDGLHEVVSFFFSLPYRLRVSIGFTLKALLTVAR